MQHSENKMSNMGAASITAAGNLPPRLFPPPVNIKNVGEEEQNKGNLGLNRTAKPQSNLHEGFRSSKHFLPCNFCHREETSFNFLFQSTFKTSQGSFTQQQSHSTMLCSRYVSGTVAKTGSARTINCS